MAEPLDLDEVRAMRPCPLSLVDHEIGHGACTCVPGGVWAVLARVVDELEQVRAERDQLRRDAADWSLRAGYCRGEMSGLIADMPAGPAREAALRRVARVDALLFPADRAAAGGGTGNPAVEDQPPPTHAETEVDNG